MTSIKNNNDTKPAIAGKKNTVVKKPDFKKNTAKVSRWLHIYLSMVSFAVVLFFAVTGLTLNHPSWFGADKQVELKSKGSLNAKWVNNPDTNKMAKLEIVEFLRKTHNIKGFVSEFRIDDAECDITFKGPAYACDIFIDREKGSYDLTELKSGLVAKLNDLHKGRDSGSGWGWLIDISAVFLTLVSLTGLILMCFLKKKRLAGLATAAIGLVLCYLIYIVLVP